MAFADFPDLSVRGCEVDALPMVWTSDDAGLSWTCSGTPQLLPKMRATTVVYEAPAPLRMKTVRRCELVCVIGGTTKDSATSGCWDTLSADVLCSNDGGDSWSAQPSLPVKSRDGTAVQVGDKLFYFGGYRGRKSFGQQQQDVFWAPVDSTTCSVGEWSAVTGTPFQEPRKHMLAVRSLVHDTLYVGAGVELDADGAPIDTRTDMWDTGSDPTNVTQWQRVVMSLPGLPSVEEWNEPPIAVFEVALDRVHATNTSVAAITEYNLADIIALPLTPALVLLTLNRIFTSPSYGRGGWTPLDSIKYPVPLYNDALNTPAWRRATLVQDNGYDHHKTAAIVAFRDNFPDILRAYVTVKCQDACSKGNWTDGCREHPWDAPCMQCSTCTPGITYQTAGCRGQKYMGYADTECMPCTQCSSDAAIASLCNGTKDTVCSLNTFRPDHGGNGADGVYYWSRLPAYFEIAVPTVGTGCLALGLIAMAGAMLRTRFSGGGSKASQSMRGACRSTLHAQGWTIWSLTASIMQAAVFISFCAVLLASNAAVGVAAGLLALNIVFLVCFSGFALYSFLHGSRGANSRQPHAGRTSPQPSQSTTTSMSPLPHIIHQDNNKNTTNTSGNNSNQINSINVTNSTSPSSSPVSAGSNALPWSWHAVLVFIFAGLHPRCLLELKPASLRASHHHLHHHHHPQHRQGALSSTANTNASRVSSATAKAAEAVGSVAAASQPGEVAGSVGVSGSTGGADPSSGSVHPLLASGLAQMHSQSSNNNSGASTSQASAAALSPAPASSSAAAPSPRVFATRSEFTKEFFVVVTNGSIAGLFYDVLQLVLSLTVLNKIPAAALPVLFPSIITCILASIVGIITTGFALTEAWFRTRLWTDLTREGEVIDLASLKASGRGIGLYDDMVANAMRSAGIPLSPTLQGHSGAAAGTMLQQPWQQQNLQALPEAEWGTPSRGLHLSPDGGALLMNPVAIATLDALAHTRPAMTGTEARALERVEMRLMNRGSRVMRAGGGIDGSSHWRSASQPSSDCGDNNTTVAPHESISVVGLQHAQAAAARLIGGVRPHITAVRSGDGSGDEDDDGVGPDGLPSPSRLYTELAAAVANDPRLAADPRVQQAFARLQSMIQQQESQSGAS